MQKEKGSMDPPCMTFVDLFLCTKDNTGDPKGCMVVRMKLQVCPQISKSQLWD